MKPVIFAVAICGVAAACVPQGDMADNSLPAPGVDACGAEPLQYLVGRPASVLATMRFRDETRILRPDTPMTMDYRIDRLNIDVSAAERITRVHCT